MASAQSCGDTVIGMVILNENLICPSGHGVFLGNGAILDCAGHSITGGEASEQYGIYLRNVDGAVVKDCTVQRFEVGIRLRGATNGTVQDTITQHNKNQLSSRR